MSHSSRRDFLKLSAVLPTLPALASVSLPLEAFPQQGKAKSGTAPSAPQGGKGDPRRRKAFTPLPYTLVDDVSVAKGFTWYPLASRGDVINAQGDTFGDCCDYTHFIAGATPDQAFLWVNHEYIVEPLLYGKVVKAVDKSKEMVDAEMKLVGGSFVELKRVKAVARGKARWEVVRDSKRAFRVDANTSIPMVGAAGGRTAIGMMGNCSGGFTPWGTILTCEENVDVYYHETDGETYGWGKHYQRALEDYGWVVEVDVGAKSARKLTALGRFAHEGATFVKAKDGRAVVYMGDDARFQYLYKFISKGRITGDAAKDKDLLVEGDLFVADLGKGQWLPLSPDNKKLAEEPSGKFKTLAGILTHTRDAAKVLKATPLNRPEDIEVHPQSGTVFVALTNNDKAGDFYGSILALDEDGADHTSMSFSHRTHAVGGPQIGFACPDNLCFGPQGSLWVGTDISGSVMGKGSLKNFPRNSLLRMEVNADGQVFARHFLQGPIDAEVTGPSFSDDFRSLFVSMQHPGETSDGSAENLTSHWPKGKGSVPLSTVIVVEEDGGRFA